jgi:uncharacterized RDD family membrane protein YckC
MPETFIFCSKCGARNAGVSQFCQSCGAGLSAGLPQAQSAAPALAYAAPPAVYAASTVRYGGFWIRLLAYLLDHIILGAVGVPLFVIFALPAAVKVAHEAQRNQQPSPELMAAMFGSIFVFALIASAGQWLYEALLTSSSWQGTLGKRILSLKVTDEAGNRISFARATGRFFAKILSSMFCGIGFLMIAFTDRKRGLHDMIAGTLVIRY